MRDSHAEMFGRFNDPSPGGAARDENVFRPSGLQRIKVYNGPGRSEETPKKAQKIFEKGGSPRAPAGKNFPPFRRPRCRAANLPGSPERARPLTRRSLRADGGPGTQADPERHQPHAEPGPEYRQTQAKHG